MVIVPKTACFSIICRDVVKLLSRIETFLSTNTFKIALEQEKEGRLVLRMRRRVNIVRGLRKVVSRERQMRKVGVYKLSLLAARKS